MSTSNSMNAQLTKAITRGDIRWLTLLGALGVFMSAITITFSQEEDMGFWLSMVATFAEGKPLYAGFFDIKDPLFMWASTFAYSVFGKPGPYWLDALAVAVSGSVAYLTSKTLLDSRKVSAVAGFVFLATLSGVFFQSFRTGTIALVLLVYLVFLFNTRKYVFSGITLAIILAYKFAYAPIVFAIAVYPIAVLIKKRHKKNLFKFFSSAAISIACFLFLLVARGEFDGYLKMMKLNFHYREVYPAVVGQDGSILGHIANIDAFGSNSLLLILATLVMLIIGIRAKDPAQKGKIIQVSIISIGLLLFLFLTVMWPHHLQPLAVLAWTSTVGFGLIIGGGLVRKKWQKIAAGLLLIGTIYTSGFSLSFQPKTPINHVLNTKWKEPPEIATLEKLKLDFGNHTYGRVGLNDDLALAAFLPEGFDLVCPHYAQFGHEPDAMVDDIASCFSSKPEIIFVSPGFEKTIRRVGTHERLKEKIEYVLRESFTCHEVEFREAAKICLRRDST